MSERQLSWTEKQEVIRMIRSHRRHMEAQAEEARKGIDEAQRAKDSDAEDFFTSILEYWTDEHRAAGDLLECLGIVWGILEVF